MIKSGEMFRLYDKWIEADRWTDEPGAEIRAAR